MTEQLLNGVQVKPFGEQVRGVAMTQTVGGDLFMDVARARDAFNGSLYGLSAHGTSGAKARLRTGSGGEKQRAVAVCCPVPAQGVECAVWQYNHPIFFTALGQSDMDEHATGVDIGNGEVECFGESQTHAEHSEDVALETRLTRGSDHSRDLIMRENVGEFFHDRRFNDIDPVPLSIEHVVVEELKSATIRFDSTP